MSFFHWDQSLQILSVHLSGFSIHLWMHHPDPSRKSLSLPSVPFAFHTESCWAVLYCLSVSFACLKNLYQCNYIHSISSVLSVSARVIHVVGCNSSFFISVFMVHLLYQFIHSVLMNIWIVSSLWSLLIKLLLKALCLSFSEHVLLFLVDVFSADNLASVIYFIQVIFHEAEWLLL